MDRDSYCRFIDKICDSFEMVVDRESMYNICTIKLNDYAFTMYYGGETAPDKVMVVVDLGPVPTKYRAEILERMLETNLFALGDNTSHFGYTRASQHALLMRAVPFLPLTVDAYMEVLVSMMQIGSMWRGTYFLSPDQYDKLVTEQTANPAVTA